MSSHNTLSDTCHLEFAGLGGSVAYGFAVLHPRVLWKNPKRAHDSDVAEAADGVVRVQRSEELDEGLILVSLRRLKATTNACGSAVGSVVEEG
eukprot:2819828-Rhodomonas_salina.1